MGHYPQVFMEHGTWDIPPSVLGHGIFPQVSWDKDITPRIHRTRDIPLSLYWTGDIPQMSMGHGI